MHGVISEFSNMNLFDMFQLSAPCNHPVECMPGLPCMCVCPPQQSTSPQPRSVRPSVRTLLFPIFLRCYPRRSLARRCDGFGFGNNFTSVVDSSSLTGRRRHTRQRRLRFSRKVREEGHSTESAGEQGFFSVTVKVEDFCHFVQKVDGYFQFPIVFLPEL